MVKLFIGALVIAAAACTPGSGEYGKCSSTPECQINLVCVEKDGVRLNDAGQTYYDGGWCRHTCQVPSDCAFDGETCNIGNGGIGGFCSKDGGY